jgi:hypothetical protein
MSDDTVSRDEFFNEAQTDAVPDRLNLHLHRNLDQPNEYGYSVEGFETVGYQMHDFLMARTLAFYRRHGRWPEGVTVDMRLRWDGEADELAKLPLPWFSLNDPAGGAPLVPDGERRLRPFLAERREKKR